MDGAALLAALKGAPGGNEQQRMAPRAPPPGFGGPPLGGAGAPPPPLQQQQQQQQFAPPTHGAWPFDGAPSPQQQHQQLPAGPPPHWSQLQQQQLQQAGGDAGSALLEQLHRAGSGGGAGGAAAALAAAHAAAMSSPLTANFPGAQQLDGAPPPFLMQQLQQQHQQQQQPFGGLAGLGPLPPALAADGLGDDLLGRLAGLHHQQQRQQQQQQFQQAPPLPFETPPKGFPPGFGPPSSSLTPQPHQQPFTPAPPIGADGAAPGGATPGQGASLLQQLQARGALYSQGGAPPPPEHQQQQQQQQQWQQFQQQQQQLQQQQTPDGRSALQHAADSLLQQLHHHPPLQPGMQQQAAEQILAQQNLQLQALERLRLQAGDAGGGGAFNDARPQAHSPEPQSPPPIRTGPPGRTRHRPPPALPPLRCDLRALDEELAALAASLAPPAEEMQRHRSAYEGIKNLLRSQYPSCGVLVFGSAANALGIRDNNDIDVSLSLDGLEDTREAKGEFVEDLEKLFLEHPDLCGEVFAIPRARIPVIKLVWKPTDTKVDITLNNDLAVANTALLRDYAAIDPRLRQLVLLIKHWAKRRRVNNAYTGTLSSYAYCLMAIAHLQQRSPPVLPILQEGAPTRQQTIGKWNCDYFNDVAALQGWGAQNRESIAELFASFFYYWAAVHDYRAAVLTVRRGDPMTKSEKGWTMRIGTERHLVCIEDPFETSHDLGRTVGPMGADRLKGEFRRAWRVVRESRDVMAELFAPAPEEDRALWDSATPERDRRPGGTPGRGNMGPGGRGGRTPRGGRQW